MTNDWYKTVDANCKLTQGDLIFNCPIVTWKSQIPQLDGSQIELEILKASVDAIKADIVVMTQACDLENQKVENIILCPHYALSKYKQDWEEAMKDKDQNPSSKAWKRMCNDIKDGYLWNLSMLNSYNNENLNMEHRIVDFHEVYTIPHSFLESLIQKRREPRPRLLPPYREHLSQAFARFFMRVGLPVSVEENW